MIAELYCRFTFTLFYVWEVFSEVHPTYIFYLIVNNSGSKCIGKTIIYFQSYQVDFWTVTEFTKFVILPLYTTTTVDLKSNSKCVIEVQTLSFNSRDLTEVPD